MFLVLGAILPPDHHPGWISTLLLRDSTTLRVPCTLLLQGLRLGALLSPSPALLLVVGSHTILLWTRCRRNTDAAPNRPLRVSQYCADPLSPMVWQNCPDHMQIRLGAEGPTREGAQGPLPCCRPSIQSSGSCADGNGANCSCQCNI